MPTVKLSKYECARGVLPRVCMRCGAEAEETKSRTFSWFHPLAYLGLVAGLLPFLIIALVLTKRMSVEVPFCREHRGHWRRRAVLSGGTLAVAFAAAVGAFLYMTNQPPGARGDLAGFLCAGSVVLLVGWVILAVILEMTAIRASEITDRTITLVGVDEQFIAALEEDRDRDRADGRDRRRRYGDVRDDYDDEWEPPERRGRRTYDDWDDDDRPRRRRSEDWDDDDRPRRRSRE